MTSLRWSEASVILLLVGSMLSRLMGQLARARGARELYEELALDLLRMVGGHARLDGLARHPVEVRTLAAEEPGPAGVPIRGPRRGRGHADRLGSPLRVPLGHRGPESRVRVG
jgi:hypothetical protein